MTDFELDGQKHKQGQTTRLIVIARRQASLSPHTKNLRTDAARQHQPRARATSICGGTEIFHSNEYRSPYPLTQLLQSCFTSMESNE